MNSSNPFSQRLAERKSSSEILPSTEPTQSPSNPFTQRNQERKEEDASIENEGLWGKTKRGVARTLSSLESNISGLPHTAKGFAEELKREIKSVGEKVLPEEITKQKNSLLDPQENQFKSPKEFKELNKNLFGKKLLEPRNEWEKFFDEVTDDFILGAMPVLGGPVRIVRPLFASIGSNVVKEGAEALGASEDTSSKVKIGALLTSYLINPGSGRQLERRLYNQQERALPRDAAVDAPHLQAHIRNFRTALQRGGTAPSKTGALTKLDELEAAFVNGRVPVRELTAFKRSINELIADRYSAIGVSKEGSAATLHNLNRIGHAIDRTITRYGNRNPEWHNIYRQANEVHGAMSRGAQIRNWLDKQRKGALKNAGLAHALGHGISAPVAAGAIAAELGIRAGSLMAKITSSPTLMQHYLQFVNGAVRQNLLTVNKELEKIDSILKKED